MAPHTDQIRSGQHRNDVPSHLPVTDRAFGDPTPHNRTTIQITLTNTNPLNGRFKQENIAQIQRDNSLARREDGSLQPERLLQPLHLQGFLAPVRCLRGVRAHSHAYPRTRYVQKPQQRNVTFRKGLGLNTVHATKTELLPLGEDLHKMQKRGTFTGHSSTA